jgi:hypothetical protein
MRRQPTSSEAQARRIRHLDAQLVFCATALARGRTLAARGELESASRTMWLVEDAADALRPVLARDGDTEGLNEYQTQLTLVLRDLNALRQYLGIPHGSA